jgi:hypothetical protein
VSSRPEVHDLDQHKGKTGIKNDQININAKKKLPGAY